MSEKPPFAPFEVRQKLKIAPNNQLHHDMLGRNPGLSKRSDCPSSRLSGDSTRRVRQTRLTEFREMAPTGH